MITYTTERLDNLPILFQPLNLQSLSNADLQSIAAIDAALPQTQCGLCGHHDGCLPYAYGIVMHGEAINLCVPGGQSVTDTIANILNRPTKLATPSQWQIDPQTNRPKEVRAIIQEADCIGCTKCIPACPVDAIVGTAKHMHSIITDLCTGCELCLAPCPVDCIDVIPHLRQLSDADRITEQNHLRRRYHQHLDRVAMTIEQGTKPVVSTIESAMVNVLNQRQNTEIDEIHAKNAIAAAKLRTQIKKLNKQLTLKADADLQNKLDKLNAKLSELQP